MERFFKLSLDMLSISNLEGKFEQLNPAWERTLGYTVEELMARPFLEFVHPDDHERTLLEFSKLIEDSTHETHGFENRYICKDGTIKILSWEARQDPERERIYAIARDDTELKRAREALEQFAFHAAHDMQEPLRKISAFGERLQKYEEHLPERGQMYLGRMLDASRRMANLIDDLLKYARVSKGSVELENVELDEVFREILDEYATRLAESGAEVTLDGLEAVQGDWTQVRQLFQNLVSNAIKFRREGVPVRVTVRGQPQDDGRLRVTVADNGIGFEEKYLGKIFQVFQRLHGRGQYEGTGIGLAVCARIAESHGGSIEARSEPGEGAVFVVTLPLAEKVEQES